jgi:hypothetical protein
MNQTVNWQLLQELKLFPIPARGNKNSTTRPCFSPISGVFVLKTKSHGALGIDHNSPELPDYYFGFI